MRPARSQGPAPRPAVELSVRADRAIAWIFGGAVLIEAPELHLRFRRNGDGLE